MEQFEIDRLCEAAIQRNQNMKLEWFALRVKSNREQATATTLEGKGLEVFLPRYQRPGNSKQEILFPGYLFCRFNIAHRLPILVMPSVVNILGFGKVPVPVDETEIESLRIAVNSGVGLELEQTFQPGNRARVERGPLAGAEGMVVGIRKQKLILSVTLLQRSLSVEVESDWVTPFETRTMTSSTSGAL